MVLRGISMKGKTSLYIVDSTLEKKILFSG